MIGLPNPGHIRNKNAEKDDNDADHDEKLDETETSGPAYS